MGLTGDINRIGYHMREMRIVDDRGKRITGFGTKVFGELTKGRYVTLGRSDLHDCCTKLSRQIVFTITWTESK